MLNLEAKQIHFLSMDLSKLLYMYSDNNQAIFNFDCNIIINDLHIDLLNRINCKKLIPLREQKTKRNKFNPLRFAHTRHAQVNQMILVLFAARVAFI